MTELHYSVLIDADPSAVWDTMLGSDSYKKWAKAFSPESQFDGEWVTGNTMNFFDPQLGGSKGFLTEVSHPALVHIEHTALLSRSGDESTTGEMAQKWIGTIEEYTFTEKAGSTEVAIKIETHPDFAKMFEDSWPTALQYLKALCES